MTEPAQSSQFEPLHFDRGELTNPELLELYRALLLPRLIEEKSLKLLRQGKISKWFSGIGQEAIAVGATLALDPTDSVLPLHRNLGVFTSRGLPLPRLFAQWQGKALGYTNGRDRSFHFGAPEHHVIGMISHLGAMLGVADGIALGHLLDGQDGVALAFSGDGGASEGDFHEALNVAAVWDLPVIFVVENNGYGLSTPSRDQFRCEQFVDKAKGYGIEGVQVDGNNIIEVYRAVSAIRERMRHDKRPVLLEAMTFRMRGHEEASGTRYVPQELFELWNKKDPVTLYEQYLIDTGVLSDDAVSQTRSKLQTEINAAWDEVLPLSNVQSEPAVELGDVYAPFSLQPQPPTEAKSKRRFIDAVSEGLGLAMERDPKLVIMGQDVAEYGGVFKVTEGFVERFGKERVRNTPICESAIVGAALGLSLAGHSAVMEMQFSDFVTCGFNQVVNNLAKTHYRWGHPVSVVVRMPTGGGVGAGPFHSQSTEAWFTHVPGLKVAYPATPFDAKGLLATSIEDPNPVMFFEHKLLYRSLEGPVPDGYYNLPFGEARVAHPGDRATIVTYGVGVHWALELAQEINGIEVIDLRTLVPWDRERVFESVKKTSRCLVLHEDTLTGGFGAEIAAVVSQEMFQWLDAPVIRVGSLDTPVPFAKPLEGQFLASAQLRQNIDALLAY